MLIRKLICSSLQYFDHWLHAPTQRQRHLPFAPTRQAGPWRGAVVVAPETEAEVDVLDAAALDAAASMFQKIDSLLLAFHALQQANNHCSVHSDKTNRTMARGRSSSGSRGGRGAGRSTGCGAAAGPLPTRARANGSSSTNSRRTAIQPWPPPIQAIVARKWHSTIIPHHIRISSSVSAMSRRVWKKTVNENATHRESFEMIPRHDGDG
jgi:hypothetical protein